MKHILLMIAVVALVGCGEKKPLIRNHIEEAIREKLEKPEGELTKADYEKVTELDFKNNQLTNVKGLEKLTQLKELDLFGNKLTSVKGLEKLTQLKELYLENNPDLIKAQIAELKKALSKCNIWSNANELAKGELAKVIEKAIRRELKYTGELTKAHLEKVEKLNLNGRLNLNGNQLTDVKGLEKLTQLTYLSLYNNQLTDVKGLEKLTKLERLNLTINKLTNVKGLEKLPLTHLNLYKNKLTSVKSLEKIHQLEYLNLDKNPLTDVKGLDKHFQLRELILYDIPKLTKAQIAELQKALPRCQITSNPKK